MDESSIANTNKIVAFYEHLVVVEVRKAILQSIKKMLHLIGLGLGDMKDVTVKGLEIIRKCDRVYLETYTSILPTELKNLEQFYGHPILEADRELVENNANEILPKSKEENVAFLVVGDPFGATTHSDLVLRARKENLQINVVHNASILNAVGCCGLEMHRFGEIVSIPYWTENWQPSSFYDKIFRNRQRNLHTLCLLDIKVKEPTLESLMKKKKEYMPPKFMTVSEAATQLIDVLKTQMEEKELDDSMSCEKLHESSTVIGLARVGWDDQRIAACSLREMTQLDLGPPLHCMVIPAAPLSNIEGRYLEFIKKDFLKTHENKNELL